MQKRNSTYSSGITTVFVLVFGSALSFVVVGLTTLTVLQLGVLDKKITGERALHIAEAGLQSYKWFLSHYPTDITNGTGNPGPFVSTYVDPVLGAIGTHSVSVTGNYQCNELTSVDITSTGTVTNRPELSKTVTARSSYPSSAEYSFIFNTPARLGSTSVTTGAMHSNSGIVMEGTHNSLVQSAVSTWNCTSTYGCNPSAIMPGVFGSGGNSSLWRFPVPSINFATLVDLNAMKSRAQNYGRYHGNYGAGVRSKGYHVMFRSDGQYDLYRVTASSGTAAVTPSNTATTDYHTITAETFLGTYTVPSTCSVIFVEDTVWVEGVVKGKVTLVVADLVSAGFAADAVIQNNLTRNSTTGDDGLTIIAERNILMSYNVPNVHTVEGILVALSGYVGRNKYSSSLPNTIRDTLIRVGSLVTYSAGALAYGGTPISSGYINRISAYDRALVFSPPPFTPNTSNKTRLIRWREVE